MFMKTLVSRSLTVLFPLCRNSFIVVLLNPKQPRSFLRTSLRVEWEPVDELEVAWTCRKLHHRAEASSAAHAGTNQHNESADPTNLQLRSTRPDFIQLSNNVPLVRPNHGQTDYPVSNTAPINCLANETTGQ